MVGEYVCTLSEELLQRAKEEINEVPERRADDIEHIRDWLKHQPHITARLGKSLPTMFSSASMLHSDLGIFKAITNGERVRDKTSEILRLQAHDLADKHTDLADRHTDLADRHTDLADRHTDLADRHTDLAYRHTDLTHDTLLTWHMSLEETVTKNPRMHSPTCLYPPVCGFGVDPRSLAPALKICTHPFVTACKICEAGVFRVAVAVWCTVSVWGGGGVEGLTDVMMVSRRMFLPLPGYDNEGRKVVIIRTALHDPKVTSMEEVFKATHLISDVLWMEDEQMSVTGVVQLLDMADVTPAHGMQMTPALVKKAMTIWQV
nr:uncharacterized protein LOC128694561 [Cherax quadricarinatus]